MGLARIKLNALHAGIAKTRGSLYAWTPSANVLLYNQRIRLTRVGACVFKLAPWVHGVRHLSSPSKKFVCQPILQLILPYTAE